MRLNLSPARLIMSVAMIDKETSGAAWTEEKASAIAMLAHSRRVLKKHTRLSTGSEVM
jgi:hypothetical protein